MYCYKCGHKLEDDANVCIECGTKVIRDTNNKREENVSFERSSSRENEYRRNYNQYSIENGQGKNIILAGVLNLIIPGVGRLYLGYIGTGIAQLLLSFIGVGAIWSFIDAIIMFTGGVTVDGSGNPVSR